MIRSIMHSIELPLEYLEPLKAAFPGALGIPVPRSNIVYASIASHPDIFAFTPNGLDVVVSSELSDEICKSLSSAGLRVIRSCVAPKGEYPHTCVLNAVRVGKYIFHNTRHTDLAIKDLAAELGFELVHINQGYARCSVIPVGEDSLITCDAGIAKTALSKGLDCILVSTDKLLLPGQRHGFIGGSTGVTSDGAIFFLGDLSQHTDGISIISFLSRHKIQYMDIPGLPLFVAGSILLI